MKKLVILFSLLVVVISGCGIITRNASQVGYVTAIEENGLMFKAYRVYTKSELESSQEEYWCVENTDVIKKLEEAKNNRQRIKMIYHNEVMYSPNRCHGGYDMIDSVEIL